MVKGPGDKIDKDDYDDIEEYIADAMAEGYTIEASDFEGRPCFYCGELLDFAEWMRDPDAIEVWDVRVHDVEKGEDEPYFHRHYFCDEECKKDAQWDIWAAKPENAKEGHGEPDVIHEDEVEGMV